VTDGLDIAFFGSSLVSSWWNGAATYYRGIVHGLAELGHRVRFYEPIAYDRHDHRDIADPDWAEVIIYPADDADAVRKVVRTAADADVIAKTSGVGIADDILEAAVIDVAESVGALAVFYDVDAPATLSRLEQDPADPLRALLARFDLVATYGGGPPVQQRYADLGARRCELVYNAVDERTHHPVAPEPRFAADLSLLANRLPDREERIDEFFFRAASLLPQRSFLLGGNGWDDKPMPANVRWIGHVGTAEHNAFNCSATAVLNVTRDSMAANGWSPATRVFEAAGVGACLLSDAWTGFGDFLQPGTEVLLATDGVGIAELVDQLDVSRARRIGAAARLRVLRDHTYARRAAQLDHLLRDARASSGGRGSPR
jgi:spore maturation protein CgeB